jgi:hypothetical protein
MLPYRASPCACPTHSHAHRAHSAPSIPRVCTQFTKVGPVKLPGGGMKSRLFSPGDLAAIYKECESKYSVKKAVEQAYWSASAPFCGISPASYGFASEIRARLPVSPRSSARHSLPLFLLFLRVCVRMCILPLAWQP